MTRWRMLCYHTLDPQHVQGFKDQLAMLRDMGWHFCSVDQGLSNLQRQTPGRFVTISFDDGDRTVCDNAQPVLDAQNIPAMLYLSTDYALRGVTYGAQHSGRPAATWPMLARWVEAGHELGAHTHTHADLSQLTAHQVRRELKQNRLHVRERLGLELAHLSYPWGQHSPAVHDQLRAEGWASAATIDRGWNSPSTNPLTLHRDLAEPHWRTAQLRRLLLLGSIGPLYRLQRAVRGR